MLAARLGYLWDTMGEGPGLSSSSQGNGLLSERNRPGCWQPHVLGVPWWRCPREASLFRSWCVHSAPKAGGAGSGSSLLWILSKPQDCSKALHWLGYSLVDRPQPAPDSPHYCHHLAEPFLLSFSSWLCFSLCGFDPEVHLCAVVSLSGRNNCFVHLQSPNMESRAGGPFSSLTPAYFCWAHLLYGEHWSNQISAIFWGDFVHLIALWMI